MRTPTMTDQDKTRLKYDKSWLVLSAAPESDPVKTETTDIEDGEFRR